MKHPNEFVGQPLSQGDVDAVVKTVEFSRDAFAALLIASAALKQDTFDLDKAKQIAVLLEATMESAPKDIQRIGALAVMDSMVTAGVL